MTAISNWMHVEIFTVNQAAALWCGYDPSRMKSYDVGNPSEVNAIKQMLTGAITTNQLRADSQANVYSKIGDYSETFVSRDDLKAYARQRELYPGFLFDTLAPFDNEEPLQAFQPLRQSEPVQTTSEIFERNVGGRPRTYDWDSFFLEVVYRANGPDGLPEVQAELIRDMLQWFSDAYGAEPAESAVKLRVSKIYNYIKEAKNRTG